VRVLLICLGGAASFSGGMVWWNVSTVLATLDANSQAIARIEKFIAGASVRAAERDRQIAAIEAGLADHEHRVQDLTTRITVLESTRTRR